MTHRHPSSGKLGSRAGRAIAQCLLALSTVTIGLIGATALLSVPASAAVGAVSTATTATAIPSPPFGLPFAVGEKAVLVQGPHTNNADVCSYPNPGSAPCNALDLAPSSGIVRAAGAGTVHLFSFCPNLVMIDHGDGWITGYYHLINITVANGQQVQAGDPLGNISEAHGCGGTASVPHVHFFVKYSPSGWAGVGDPFQNTAIDQDLQDFTLAGWQISGRQWSSCLTYVSSGQRQCAGSSITNYGMGAPTPTVAAALIPGTRAGYSLNGDGTLTPFGGAPAATQGGHQWPNWNIARGLAILPNGTGGYVLDGYGGVHPFAIGGNPMPPGTSGGPYWSGWDIARGLVLNPAGTGGYVLDGWGGLHPFAIGGNPLPAGTSGGPYWSGWDIARAVALNPAGTGGYVLDGWGGIHPFAIGGNPVPPAVHGASWPNWDIARAIVIDFTGTSGYTLDGYGGLHPFYADGTPVPPAPQVSDYTSGQDLARAVVLYQATQAADQPGGVSGVVLDANSATPHPFTTGADGRAVAFLPGSSTAGYTLSGDGTLTPFGGASAATQAGHQWPNRDIARGAAILPNGTGGYVLDGYGGVHPFAIGSNPMPPGTSGGPYWNGWDIARGLVLNPAATGGYVLDGYGGVHPFAIGSNPMPPGISSGAYYGGWDVMDGLALGADGKTAALVDSHNGVHLS